MRKKAKVKLTKNQAEYKKQVRRIYRNVNKLLSEGAIIETDFIPSTNLPKRVTKKLIADLKSITPKQIRNRAEIEYQGEYVTVNEKIKYEKEKKRLEEEKKRILSAYDRARVIIDNFDNQLRGFPGKLPLVFLTWSHDMEMKYGALKYARSLEEMPSSMQDIFISVNYDYGAAMDLFESSMLEYMPDTNEEAIKELQSEIEGADYAWDDI